MKKLSREERIEKSKDFFKGIAAVFGGVWLLVALVNIISFVNNEELMFALGWWIGGIFIAITYIALDAAKNGEYL